MKAIPGYEDYLINEDGTKIYSKKTEKYLKIGKNVQHCKTRDYISPVVCLYKDGTSKIFYISRLVYTTFIGEIQEGFDIDHIDNDPQNNSYLNLQLLSHRENSKKRFKDDQTLRKRISEANKGKIISDEIKQKISEAVKNSKNGKVWVNNGKINKFVGINEIPVGFVRGRFVSRNIRLKISFTKRKIKINRITSKGIV